MPITTQPVWQDPGFRSDPVFGVDDWVAQAEGGYPVIPEVAPLTVAQVQDMANACAIALETGKPAHLAMPFTYAGPSLPGIRNGDSIEYIVVADGAQGDCITNAEAERICRSQPDAIVCAQIPTKVPMWAYAVGGVGVLAIIWYVIK